MTVNDVFTAFMLLSLMLAAFELGIAFMFLAARRV